MRAILQWSLIVFGCVTSLAAALGGQGSSPGADVLGPAPLFTLRGRARSQLVVKADDRDAAIWFSVSQN